MSNTKPAFSRKALNVIIFVTAVMILVFSQMGEKKADQENDSTTQVAKAPEPGNALSVEHFFPELKTVPALPETDISVNIEHWTTPEGLKVYFVPAKSLPMVDIRLVMDAGSAKDPVDQAGLAGAVANMLQLGAQDLGPTDIAKRFELLGSLMSTGSYRDMAIGSLRTLREDQYFKPSLDLFVKVMTQMEFNEQDLARELQRQKVGIAHKAQSPKSQLSDALFDVLYSSDHPYGRPSSGTNESVANIDEAAIRAFHQKYYVADNSVLAVVGDISKGEVADIAAMLSTKLNAGEAPAPVPRTTQNVKDTTRHIEFESDQTHIGFIGPGIFRGAQEHHALYLTNHILGGGGFASLLNKQIRQEKAFAYSVGSAVMPMAGLGPVMIQMQTRSDQAAAAIAATQQVIDELATNGPDAQVLADAKQQIVSEFAKKVASNSSQLGYLGSMGFYDLPLDSLATFNERITKVTAEDVKAMAAQYFQNMAVVTVGKEKPI